ncbi:MAG: hypothetical protein RLZZ385_1115 [Pseudomonadota bacterium]
MNSLRRSLHFVPGSSERMFRKALTLAADSLILDLEDSVTPDNKCEARRQVCDWLGSADWQGQEKLVRINALDSPWGRDDLEAVLAAGPDGIVLPKIQDRSGVTMVEVLLSACERAHGRTAPTPLILIGTEDAAAALNLQHTLDHPRIEAVVWAAEDLSVSLGAKTRRNEAGEYLPVFQLVRSLCLLAAAANHKQAIDGPFTDIRDLEGLQRECRLTAAMGYTGKLTIHPDQVPVVNEAFSPSAAEQAAARELVEAFARQQSRGQMAFNHQGRMVDVPHLRQAEALLARAELIHQRRKS